MAISLSSLRKVTADKPPFLLIYGPEGMGKTTLAAEFPAPVFIQTEDGAPKGVTIDSFGLLTSFAEVDEALAELATAQHDFRTLNVDSVGKLEKLVQAETCRRNNWKTIEQPGFGKGYAEADYVWLELIDAFRYLRDNRGMNVNLIGHSVTERFDDPETLSYSRYQLDIQKRAMAIITREVDAILLVKKDVTIKVEGPNAKKGEGRARADGGDTRWIYCEGRPAFQAKNRFDMPDRLMFAKGQGFTALAPFLPVNQAPPPAVAEKKAA